MDARAPRLIADGAWCWWTKPRATVIDGETYLGVIDEAGAIVVAHLDLDGRETVRAELARVEDDDHNNPALLVDRERPPICAYARHDEEPFVRLRIGARPLDLAEWGPEQRVGFPGVTSYAQLHPFDDRLLMFSRAGVTAWCVARSDDWGRTWSEGVPFIALDTDQEVYMPTALLPDGRTVRVAISGHPKRYERRPVRDVLVCLIDLETSDITRPGDGVRIGNVRSGEGLPLDESSLELAHRPEPGRTLNLFDVGRGERFEIGFASKREGDRATVDGAYEVAALTADGWRTEHLVASGGIFGYIHAGMYVGGLAFPSAGPSGRVAIARESDGTWHLEEWTRGDDGVWQPAPLAPPGRSRLVRPWALEGAAARGYLALELERYDGSYVGTRSHVVGPVPVG